MSESPLKVKKKNQFLYLNVINVIIIILCYIALMYQELAVLKKISFVNWFLSKIRDQN